MYLLIDGYNLLHATGVARRGKGPHTLHSSRQALLNVLASSIAPKDLPRTVIVFDAAGAPPGLPRTVNHRGMTVHYARGYADADAMLEELIANHDSVRSLTVVSSDHRVQRAARRRRARFVDSDHWFAHLLAERRRRRRSLVAPTEKLDAKLDAAEITYWTEQFTQAGLDAEIDPENRDRRTKAELNHRDPPAATTGNTIDPFPPGYADDLTDELDDCSP